MNQTVNCIKICSMEFRWLKLSVNDKQLNFDQYQLKPKLISTFYITMLQLSCSQIQQCPSMSYCEFGTCVHDDIFPLSTYTIFIYLFMGVVASFCNVAGNSMGMFKILILMILLNYELDEATGLAQAMVVGGAIPNFISIVLKKHPNGLTSLANYKVLALIVPCTLFGSVVGSLTQTVTPKIAQFSLLVILFSYFAYSFIQKLRMVKQPNVQKPELQGTLVGLPDPVQNGEVKQISPQKQQLLNYQKSLHLKQILRSIAVFIVFQFLSLLVQGKLPFYRVNKCSLYFPLGLCALLAIIIVYLFVVRKLMNRAYGQYRRHDIKQEIYLDRNKEFFCIILGGFAAGATQGFLGLGSGSVIMLVLLSFPISPTVASATSGYQILFSGTGSLVQYYLNGEVKVVQSLWMMGVCFVIGGAGTIFLYSQLKKMNETKVKRFLLMIVICLVLMSIALTGPTIKGIVDKEGWAGMTKISFNC